MLVFGRFFLRFEPNASHVVAGQPLVAAGREANDRLTLSTHKVVGSDTDGPTVTTCLSDNLIRRVDVRRSTYSRDRFHICFVFEHFHTDGSGSQSKEPIQIGDNLIPVNVRVIRSNNAHSPGSSINRS
jgi:hypothetical protein